MRHLSSQALIDVAEGTVPEDAVPHLASCESCRQQLSDLRDAFSAAMADADVPEPSPLFWDHLSARIRATVSAEPPPRAWTVTGRLMWRWAAAGALASLLLAAVIVWYQAPASRDAGHVPTVAVGVAEVQSHLETPAEGGFGFVAELAESLDWEAAAEAGLTARFGAVDRTLTDLSADEQLELERLLNEALAKPGV